MLRDYFSEVHEKFVYLLIWGSLPANLVPNDLHRVTFSIEVDTCTNCDGEPPTVKASEPPGIEPKIKTVRSSRYCRYGNLTYCGYIYSGVTVGSVSSAVGGR